MPPSSPPEHDVRTGIDLVPVERLSHLLSEHPDAVHEIFTAGEQAYCARQRRRDEHLAGRFAAKEAVLKALGTGLGQRMEWTDVEVVNQPTGRPLIRLHGEVERLARTRRLIALDVSISHTRDIAIAHALVLAGPSEPKSD